ncbi:MAG TPA: hypothetical protein PKC97_04975 [Burkholderiaceae bacterium]|nr:hypothetical protein [Burkholderiaceae bacterium]
MTRRCGLDTSILVHLTTCEPAQDFDRAVAALTHLVAVEHVAPFASHMVIGEARVALQHHYGVGTRDAQAGLRSVPSSGLVARGASMRSWMRLPHTAAAACSIG